jgi:serine/threonine protein kinase
MQPPSCRTCGKATLPSADSAGGRRCPECDPTSAERGGRRPAAGSPQQPAEPEFDPESMVGRVVGGRYRLESVLGQGAMGAVYRSVQVTLAKPYAIKVLLPSLARDAQLVARFQQEARIAAAIRHPGLVEVFDFGVEDGIAYFVMELLQGRTLSEYVGSGDALPAKEAVRIVADVADAVAVAHDRGVIHRDLKPANIFLARRSGGDDAVKVLDFGVSKASVFASEAPETRADSVCGTPSYMSPEQTGRGVVDARSDQYSLGVVLYRLLSGKLPFEAAEAVVVMYMHLERPPPPLEQRPGSEVSPALEDALFRALAKRPEDRFVSMRDFARALRASIELGEAPKPETIASEPPSDEPTLAPSEAAGETPPAATVPPTAASLAEEPSPGFAEPAAGRRWLAVALAGFSLCAVEVAAVALGLAARRAGADLISTIPQPQPPEDAWDSLLVPVPPAPPEPAAPIPAGEEAKPPGAQAPPEVRGAHAARPTPASAAPAAKRRPPAREPQRPQAGARPRETGELIFTSKMLGKRVEASVGGAKLELFANRVALLSVPAGRNRVVFSSKDGGVSCSVVVELPAKARRALIFGPELTSVILRDAEGARMLNCQSP